MKVTDWRIKLRTFFGKLKGPRTVLMKDCPLKWPEKSFKENDSFSIKKIVGSTLESSAKKVFSLDKFLL